MSAIHQEEYSIIACQYKFAHNLRWLAKTGQQKQ